MAKTKKPIPFNPYSAAMRLGSTGGTSGINWSYANFPTQRDMALFIVECNDNGYRTRNDHKTDDGFSVQYHHYAD